MVCVVELCHDKKDWDLLNENILTLSKKRSQLKQAVTKMVQKCVTYVDETPNKETKLKVKHWEGFSLKLERDLLDF